jgi:hypothetical protein
LSVWTTLKRASESWAAHSPTVSADATMPTNSAILWRMRTMVQRLRKGSAGTKRSENVAWWLTQPLILLLWGPAWPSAACGCVIGRICRPAVTGEGSALRCRASGLDTDKMSWRRRRCVKVAYCLQHCTKRCQVEGIAGCHIRPKPRVLRRQMAELRGVSLDAIMLLYAPGGRMCDDDIFQSTCIEMGLPRFNTNSSAFEPNGSRSGLPYALKP